MARIYINGIPTNYTIDEFGVVINATTMKVKQQYLTDNSAKVSLYVNGKNQGYKVVDIMIQTFLGMNNIPRDMVVVYKNNNPMDVSLSNIQIISKEDLYSKRLESYFTFDNGSYHMNFNGNDDERWAIIHSHGFKLPYLISDYGRVFSLSSLTLLTPILNRRYPYISIRLPDGHSITPTIHRLVASNFVPNNNPDVNNIVHHIDHNKLNAHYSNLMWCTHNENIMFEVYDDKIHRGERNGRSTITDSQAEQVCQLISTGYRDKDICDLLGIRRTVVSKIRSRQSWTHISNKYSFKNKWRCGPDNDTRIKIIKMWYDRIPVSKIHDMLQVGYNSIYKSIRQFKVLTRCQFVDNAIMSLHSSGMSVTDIASRIETLDSERDVRNIINLYTQ